MPRLRLDALDQHAAEDVGPGVVVGDADAGCARGLPPAHRGPAAPSGQRRQQIDAGESRERLPPP